MISLNIAILIYFSFLLFPCPNLHLSHCWNVRQVAVFTYTAFRSRILPLGVSALWFFYPLVRTGRISHNLPYFVSFSMIPLRCIPSPMHTTTYFMYEDAPQSSPLPMEVSFIAHPTLWKSCRTLSEMEVGTADATPVIIMAILLFILPAEPIGNADRRPDSATWFSSCRQPAYACFLNYSTTGRRRNQTFEPGILK